MTKLRSRLDAAHILVSIGLLASLALQLFNPASVLELALLNQIVCQVWVWLCR